MLATASIRMQFPFLDAALCVCERERARETEREGEREEEREERECVLNKVCVRVSQKVC